MKRRGGGGGGGTSVGRTGGRDGERRRSLFVDIGRKRKLDE